MTPKMLRVGDKVMWRGSFGNDSPREATVTEIERTNGHEKYGDDVEEIEWENRSFAVVGLDNGHWAYGDQLSPVR